MMRGHQKMMPSASTGLVLNIDSRAASGDQAAGCAARMKVERSSHFGMLATSEMAARCQVRRLRMAGQVNVAAPWLTASAPSWALRLCSHSLSSGAKNFACSGSVQAGQMLSWLK